MSDWEDVVPKQSADGWEDLDKSSSSTWAKINGGVEAAANMAVGGIAGLGGGLTYLATLAASGDKDAAKAVQEATNAKLSNWSNPVTQTGKDYQQNIQKGFHWLTKRGGEAVQGMGSASGLGFDPEALGAIGEAGTEMALNLADPALIGRGIYKGIKGSKELPTEHAARIEPVWEDVPKPVEAPTPTMAHADDYAAINPYDVGGHVTASEQGRPAVIDNPQMDMFGGEHLQESIRAPELPQDSLLKTPDNVIPYDRLSLGDGAPQPAKPMGMEVPAVPDRLALVPKEDMSVPPMNEVRVTEKALAENRAKAEAPKDTSNSVMKESMDRAVRDKAFSDLEQIASAQKDAHYQALEHLEIANKHGDIDYQRLQDMGDKTLMPKDATDSMTKALRDGDLQTAITAIAKNHPDAMYRTLADYLSTKLDGIKTMLHPEAILDHGDRQVTGYFDPNTSTVGFSGVGATSPHTVMHETLHGLTSQFMQARPNDIRVVAIKDLYNKMTSKMAKNFPGIVNAREFVAEAFSNPEFQTFLKSQRIDNRSMFTKFVDGVKNMLGMKTGIKTQLTNALEHAIDLSKQVIEASDPNTRKSIMDSFKEAGVNKKLADLMAQTPKDVKTEVVQHEGVRNLVKGIPALDHAISDFTFYDKPVGEIIEMAKKSPDIDGGVIEKLGQQLQAGGLFESLKTRNPVVKYTYERITRAFQEASNQIKVNLTSPETGLKRYMRDLSPNEKGEIHSAMILHEGQRELTSTELAARGFNEKQIAYYNKYRELSDKFYTDINERRIAMGLVPMDKRVAHMAGRFMGDFSMMVTGEVPHPTTGNLQTKFTARISGSTKWELIRAAKFLKEQHPDWTIGAQEYNAIGKGKQAADRFGGLMEAINFLTKTDTNLQPLMDSYKAYIQKDAVNYLNATRHAKDKTTQAGGIIGSEGNKPWLDTVKNAEEGMKAQLDYFEQGYQWMAMEKAVGDLKPLLGDETLAKQTPNALKYANAYKDHAMGRNQGRLSDATNTIVSLLGEYSTLGHSNFLKVNAQVKHLMMQKFMGLMNIPFTLTQLMQPLQVHPAMIALLHNRGLEFSASSAQLKATQTYLHALLQGHTSEKLSSFEQQAMKYADEMGVFDVKMADHTKDINASKFKEGYNTLADLNITAPEHLTRGTSFLFYAHALKDAGVPMKDIFGAAENMTNMTMVNYHPMERPMGYAKLGWIGDVASTLTRYKHNQLSQAAFYAREGIRGEQGLKSSVPLAAFLGTSLAFGGIMGFFGYQEADALYQMFSEHVLKKPDSLTNQLFKNNVPDLLNYGVFSTLGMDMTSRFSNANIIPDDIGHAIMPYGSGVLDMAQSTGRFVIDPLNEFKQKQWIKSMAPQSMSGLLENQFFTEKQPNGKNLYINSTDGPNLGKGRVERSDSDMSMRAFGFRDVRESKELAKNYSDSQIEKGNSNVVDSLLTKAKYAALDNDLNQLKLQQLIKQAADLGESPDSFVGKLAQWGVDQKLTQAQQQMLRNAQKGYKGAFNMKGH